MRARPVGRCSRLTKNSPMEHAGEFIDGIQITAMVMAVGALIYAVCRTFKTWDRC